MYSRDLTRKLVAAGVTGLVSMLALAACGGGGSSDTPAVIAPTTPTDQQRAQAASQTAQNNASCTAIHPFYWEIGDRNLMRAGGTAGGALPLASTSMPIASATKWLYGAYVVQTRGGHTQLTAPDILALTMRRGYTNLNYASCIRVVQSEQAALTVGECAVATHSGGSNSDLVNAEVGRFCYGGGHFQLHAAVDLSLGAANNASLRTTMAAQIGQDFTFSFETPQTAGGARSTAGDYAFFLRKILSNQLLMREALGTSAVCTNPLTCASASSTPIPISESWHYSLGHWVEDDPILGDGAFSSPGAFGFYPWIDATKTYYGVLARASAAPAASLESVACGRKIRRAWVTATAQ
jgi:hypothetical protein